MGSVGLFERFDDEAAAAPRLRYGSRVVDEARAAFDELVNERESGARQRGWVTDVLISRVLLAAQECETIGARVLSDTLREWIDSFDEPSWVEIALRGRVESELRKV